MRRNKKLKKVMFVTAGVLLIVGMAACSPISGGITANQSEEDSSEMGESEAKTQIQESETSGVSNVSNTQNSKNTQNTENAENDGNNEENTDESEELFRGAGLQGDVTSCTDTELSLSAATTETNEDGSMVMIQAVPGYEEEENLVHVAYEEDMKVQILTMDRASETQISLVDVDKTEIAKESSVLIFGSCQDTLHWTAEKIVIVNWQ